ncbi:MAG: hypothetical protein KDK99_22600 [Verrucomicrobiales bacterium]|nr:hypothetical protein [Verrucomicrobiales bacterium]
MPKIGKCVIFATLSLIVVCGFGTVWLLRHESPTPKLAEQAVGMPVARKLWVIRDLIRLFESGKGRLPESFEELSRSLPPEEKNIFAEAMFYIDENSGQKGTWSYVNDPETFWLVESSILINGRKIRLIKANWTVVFE